MASRTHGGETLHWRRASHRGRTAARFALAACLAHRDAGPPGDTLPARRGWRYGGCRRRSLACAPSGWRRPAAVRGTGRSAAESRPRQGAQRASRRLPPWRRWRCGPLSGRWCRAARSGAARTAGGVTHTLVRPRDNVRFLGGVTHGELTARGESCISGVTHMDPARAAVACTGSVTHTSSRGSRRAWAA